MGLEDRIMRYPIVIHKDAGSSYGVTVPDLPGCFSGGDTLDDACEMAQEAIVGHVETLLMERQPIPSKKLLEEHQANEDYAGGIWALVDVDLSKLSGDPVQVNIGIPAPVLAMVDEIAAREGESRSGMLTRAALSYVEQQMLA
jgi:predicted RNase H-like HicB family nuclease